MLREVEVINILTPKLQKLFIDAGIEADYVFKRWVEISQASPLDYFDVEPNGQLGQLNLNGITDAQRINLKEIKVERTMIEKTDADGEVTHAIVSEKINLKVADQQKAVDTIAKHLGLLVDRLADEDIDKIGDLLEAGVARIRKMGDPDAWKSIVIRGANVWSVQDPALELPSTPVSTNRSWRVVNPGLYSVCDGCQQPTEGDLLTPVPHPHRIYKNTMDTDWLCPVCSRKLRRSEQGEPDVSQHNR